MEFIERICHSRTQINNKILNEIEMQELRKPVAVEFFYNICYSRTQIINEILNETELQEWWKPAAGETDFYNRICHSRT